MIDREVQEGLKERGYQFEFEFGVYDYSWSIWHIYTKDRRVFALSDSGCSCYGFGDDWSSVDEVEGCLDELTSLSEAMRLMEEGVYGEKEGFSREKFLELGLR